MPQDPTYNEDGLPVLTQPKQQPSVNEDGLPILKKKVNGTSVGGTPSSPSKLPLQTSGSDLWPKGTPPPVQQPQVEQPYKDMPIQLGGITSPSDNTGRVKAFDITEGDITKTPEEKMRQNAFKKADLQQEAITNFLKRKDIKPTDKNYNNKKAALEQGLVQGKLKVQGNQGQPDIARESGAGEEFVKGVNQTISDFKRIFVGDKKHKATSSMNDDELIQYYNEKRDERKNADLTYPSAAGQVTNVVGSQLPYIATAELGGVAGGAIGRSVEATAISNPLLRTGVYSQMGSRIGTAAALATTFGKTAEEHERERRYNEYVDEETAKGRTDIDAIQKEAIVKAREQAKDAGNIAAATGIAMSIPFAKLKETPSFEGTKERIGQILLKQGKDLIQKDIPIQSGAMALQGGLTELLAKEKGYKDADPMKATLHGLADGAIFAFGAKVATGVVPEASKALSSYSKELFSGLPTPDLNNMGKYLEENQVIPEGTAKDFVNNIQEYQDASKLVPADVKDRASFVGKILKINKLQQSLVNPELFPEQHKAIQDQIDAENKDLKVMSKSDNPITHEKDDLTNEPILTKEDIQPQPKEQAQEPSNISVLKPEEVSKPNIVGKGEAGSGGVVDVVGYEDAIKITPTSELSNPEKYGTDELGMEAKTAALRDEEKTPPKFTDYKVGTYAKDKFGDLYQLQNVPIDKIVLPEGEQKREATVEKYKKWYNEGSKFPPAKGVENYAVYKGKVVINDGHHRVVAAKQLGLKEVPVWVSLTDPKNPARPITDIEYHKSLSENKQGWEMTKDEYVSKARKTDTYPEKDAMWERNQSANYSKEIKDALQTSREKVKGQYTDIPSKFQKAIDEGRMTANDAKKIIESAGLEVPKDIAEQSLKETTKAETPTQEGNAEKIAEGGKSISDVGDKKFVTHTGEEISGKKLTDAINKVADNMVESANKQRQEHYASHVTEKQKDDNLKRGIEYAEEVRQGEHLDNFTIWQRVNQELTGESVPLFSKPKNENTTNQSEGKVAELEAARDMAILREKADIGELEFIAEENLPKEEVDVMRKGEVIGTKKVPNEKLRLQQKEISDKFDKLKQLLECLTGKKGK